MPPTSRTAASEPSEPGERLDLLVEIVTDPSVLAAWVAARLDELLPRTLDRRATVVIAGATELAHQLRRHIAVERGEPGLLLGVVMTRPEALAADILVRAGRAAAPGGDDLRRLELLHRFASGDVGELGYFAADDLRRPGYVDAFARTIADLERAGLSPAGLRAQPALFAGQDDARLGDLLAIWELVDAGDHQARLSATALLRAATAAVRDRPEIAAASGPVLAVLAADPSPVLLAFLAALPAARVVMLDGRPPREPTQRWQRRVRLARVEDASPGAAAGGRELDRLRARLFLAGRPGAAASGARAGAGAPAAAEGERDTSVVLEEHASVQEEVEATAHWVLERVAAGTALEEIAVIATDVDVYAPLVIDRLARLATVTDDDDEMPPEPVPAVVLDKRPVATTAAGVRLLALLRALDAGLPAALTIPILQNLRDAENAGAGAVAERGSLSPTLARVARLVRAAGIAGGSVAHAADVHEWSGRLEGFRRRLVEEYAELGGGAAAADDACEAGGAPPPPSSVDDDEPEKRSRTRARRDAERLLALADRLLPGARALDELAELVAAGGAAGAAGGASLAALWPALAAFVERWLRLPPEPRDLMSTIAEKLAIVLASPPATRIEGRAAIAFLIDELERLRLPDRRRSQPALTIASPAAARGLVFCDLRIVGLAEGLVPRSPRDDPILPAEMRGVIETANDGAILERVDDTILADLHDLYRCVAGVREHLALSAPRQWADGTSREVSGVMLEVAMALGRRRAPGVGGDGGPATPPLDVTVPSSPVLRALYLAPGVERRRRWARGWPVLASIVLDEVGARAPDGRGCAVPPSWLVSAAGARAVRELCRLAAEVTDPSSLGATDGRLDAIWIEERAPGLAAERPLSPTRIRTLLDCPYRFMWTGVLGFDEPEAPPATDRIEPLAFGSLAHRVLELLLRSGGDRLCRRQGSQARWRERAADLAAGEFARFLDSYPLRGRGVIERERRRLIRVVSRFVDYEWEREPRLFVAAEQAFGETQPVAVPLAAGARQLYVRGKIDRIDRLPDGGLSVRDWKTGRVSLLVETPIDAGIDLQLAVYARVLALAGGDILGGDLLGDESPAASGSLPISEAVYVHPTSARDAERRFDGDALRELDRCLDRWLDLAGLLLTEGVFPRTPAAGGCCGCPFTPLCGGEGIDLIGDKLRAAGAPAAAAALAAFVTGGGDDE